ncbi:MAG: hypothetical protein EOM21_20115 [Gammaproteobacteria bacterium]|nr:hypothetical protein [Gammaproteobacteria bacterium]
MTEGLLQRVREALRIQAEQQWTGNYDDYKERAAKAKQALADLDAAMETHVLVPKEPTEEMLDVMHDKILIDVFPRKREANIINDVEVYKAMLAAAVKEKSE